MRCGSQIQTKLTSDIGRSNGRQTRVFYNRIRVRHAEFELDRPVGGVREEVLVVLILLGLPEFLLFLGPLLHLEAVHE